jgi:hypothetical protein
MVCDNRTSYATETWVRKIFQDDPVAALNQMNTLDPSIQEANPELVKEAKEAERAARKVI